MTTTLHRTPLLAGPGPRLVLLHGFTQTGACWSPVARALGEHAPGIDAVALDLPGHGGSAALDCDLWGAAEVAADTAGRATWVGYSLGARVALHVALARPDVVERLVLISGTAGLDSGDERAARRAADEALAAHLEEVGLAAFLDEWLALPLFAGIPPERRCLDARLANTVSGLASSLRRCGTGTQQPLWERLPEIEVPVVVITGADDSRFTSLGSRLAAAVGPVATHVVVPACGHTPPLEDPETTAAIVARVVGEGD